MKKTYIAPTLQVDVAEMEAMMAMSLRLEQNESGNEEYVKEQGGGESDGDWDIDW